MNTKWNQWARGVINREFIAMGNHLYSGNACAVVHRPGIVGKLFFERGKSSPTQALGY